LHRERDKIAVVEEAGEEAVDLGNLRICERVAEIGGRDER